MQEIWAATSGELEVIFSKASFTTWFKGAILADIQDDTAIVSVPSIFAKEWFEKKYHKEIIKSLNKLTNKKVNKVIYEVGAKEKTDQKINLNPPTTTPVTQTRVTETPSVNQGLSLKKDYSFDNFVVGTTNRLAYAASMAVSQNPGKAHNPLVIYGGVGLGKTHLVQAIGNTIKKERPNLKILYISCEDFANDYVQSIQSKKADSFKKKYRSIDVFLVDDIQFLSRKEGTQEEFFHTFNTLHQNDRQIVMTSDRIPTAIPDLEDRLSSRFSMGMVADVSPPNLETRQAILREKAINSKIKIPDDVLDLIATNIQSNIRELEGAFNRVLAFSSMQNIPIDMALAQEALKEFIGNSVSKKVNSDRVIDTVTKFYKISKDDLVGPRRNRELIQPRRIVMYLLRTELGLSYPKIGQAIGGKDHSTVMHAINQLEKEIGKNSDIQDEISLIKKDLYAD